MQRVLGNILCCLDPKVKVKGKKVCICDGVPSNAALVVIVLIESWMDLTSFFREATNGLDNYLVTLYP